MVIDENLNRQCGKQRYLLPTGGAAAPSVPTFQCTSSSNSITE